MEVKTALLVAVTLALVLPYVTVALVRSGSVGFVLFGVLFVGAALLVVVSDVRSDDESPEESNPE